MLEHDGERIDDADGVSLHLKCIVSVLKKKVVWFSAQQLHPTFLFLHYDLIELPHRMNLSEAEALSDADKWRLLVLDRCIGADLFVPPSEADLRITLGLSGIEFAMKSEQLFHTKNALEQALDILANDLPKSDLAWRTARVTIRSRSGTDTRTITR